MLYEESAQIEMNTALGTAIQAIPYELRPFLPTLVEEDNQSPLVYVTEIKNKHEEVEPKFFFGREVGEKDNYFLTLERTLPEANSSISVERSNSWCMGSWETFVTVRSEKGDIEFCIDGQRCGLIRVSRNSLANKMQDIFDDTLKMAQLLGVQDLFKELIKSTGYKDENSRHYLEYYHDLKTTDQEKLKQLFNILVSFIILGKPQEDC